MERMWSIYNMIRNERKKERTEMILEPFQAIVQLATLKFRPPGTKLSITGNVLVAQEPAWCQGLERSYNHDGRDDLVYLFSVVSRFHKFYGHHGRGEGVVGELFGNLVRLALCGLDSVIQTYGAGTNGSLLQSLKMYKSMLENPELCSDAPKEPRALENVDDVFIQVRNLYKEEHYTVVLGLLKLMEDDPQNYASYIGAIESTLVPVASCIQRWIHERITY